MLCKYNQKSLCSHKNHRSIEEIVTHFSGKKVTSKRIEIDYPDWGSFIFIQALTIVGIITQLGFLVEFMQNLPFVSPQKWVN